MTEPDRSGGPVKGTREYGRRASLLSVGVGLTGLLTYVYFFIASHQLDRVDYGELTVLWSAVFITVSVLYRPVDQLLSRQIAENLERGGTELGPVRVAVRIQGLLAVALALVSVLLKGPLTELFGGNETLYWIFVGAVLFYAASYFARGYLAGLQKFGPFTALILSESFFRTMFAVLVGVGIFTGQSMIALGILAAPLLSLLVVPFAIGARSRRTAAHSDPDGSSDDSDLSLTHGAGFVGSVFLIMLGEQVFLNAGPLLIRGIEGVAAAGFIFNVLMIARAPLQLFQAVSTSILPHLTALHHSHDPDSEREFHRSVRMVLAAVAAFTAFTAAVVLIAGPALMQLAFSDKFTYARVDLLIVTAGMGLYLASVTVNQACLAQGQVRRAAVRWIACAVFFVVWTLLPLISDGALRVEIGFSLTALILLASLFLIYRRPREVESDLPLEGTPEQIETKLAGLEEGAP
ncbi:MAG: lipopolysaccharide biosynthesis protein [Solirubrobacterales bacterium]